MRTRSRRPDIAARVEGRSLRFPSGRWCTSTESASALGAAPLLINSAAVQGATISLRFFSACELGD